MGYIVPTEVALGVKGCMG